MDDLPTFGTWLKRRRKALDLTQDALAVRVGCSVVSIRKFERDEQRPSRQLAELLAEQLGIPPVDRATFVQYARVGLDTAPPNLPIAAAAELPHQPINSATPPAETTILSGNLPIRLSSFIGRDRERAELAALLLRPDIRLLTLTGPGGAGKTSLALTVAEQFADAYPDGVWFVDLAPLSDADLVLSTIAQTLDVRENVGQSLRERLQSFLRQTRLLLLLDNFEQVVAAAGEVRALLSAAPHLTVLATSREPLRLTGEHEYAVQPMTTPDADVAPEQILESDAVQLFIARARAVKADFSVTSADAPLIAAICRQLDGLPLAIELAAARAKLLPLPALLARLDQRLALLTGRVRDLPQRQQTMRATIDWSYQLLEPAEQALFSRLGVFVGGWSVEAAEAVSAAEGEPVLDIFDGLAALVDKSLVVQRTGSAGEPRFTMLETIRAYALEQLAARGELDAFQRRHADYVLALVEAAEPALRRHDQIQWLDRLELELANLRAVWQWTMAHNEYDLAARLSSALMNFWELRDYEGEGRSWLDAVYPQHEQLSAHVRARLGHVRAYIHCRTGDAPAQALYEESMQWYHDLGDDQAAARVGIDFGWWMRTLDAERARSFLDHGLATLHARDDAHYYALALDGLATLAANTGDTTRQHMLLEQSLALRRAVGDRQGIAWTLLWLIWAALDRSDIATAQIFNQERLELERVLCHQQGELSSLMMAAQIAAAAGQYTDAVEYSRKAEQIAEAAVLPWDRLDALMHRAWLALNAGDVPTAIHLATHCLQLLRQQELSQRYAGVLRDIGFHTLLCGDITQAVDLLTEAHTMGRALRDEAAANDASFGLAIASVFRGECAVAQAMFEADLITLRARDNAFAVSETLLWLGRALLEQSLPLPAYQHLCEGIEHLPENNAGYSIKLAPFALETLSMCAVALNNVVYAARLLGAADALRERLGAARWPVDQPNYERTLAVVRSSMNDIAFTTGWQAGRLLRWEEVVAEVLAGRLWNSAS